MTITLYQAGAGTGKTYTITKEIIERLASGTTKPDRILATTFTRKAAAELKDRIRSRILHPEPGDPELDFEQRLEKVTAIDQALIGTVHSVGYQLLGRYAIRLGISPHLEALADNARERHLRQILGSVSPLRWTELNRLADRLSVEDIPELVEDLLDKKRGNVISDEGFRASMVAGTERLIQVISGGVVGPARDFADLYAACRTTIDRLQAGDDPTGMTRGSIERLEEAIDADSRRWQVWGMVSARKWAVRSLEDTADLVELAGSVGENPDLHAELRAFTLALVDQVIELGQLYDEYKRQRGLVDFTDLEELFLELLKEPAIRKDLSRSLDLVVVDEFQDTNPIQLAIFQELASLAPDSLWVGDEKQAIYGFRGADSALMQDVLSTIPTAQRRTLDTNYRSEEGLVNIFNEVFKPHFGPSSTLRADSKDPARLERWLLDGRNKDDRRAGFIMELRRLITSVSPGEVAILVRTNKQVTEIATDLRVAGVPVLVETPGLLSTKEGEMVMAGLRLAADPGDRLAAATISNILDVAPTPAWFEAIVADRKGRIDAPGLQEIRQLDSRIMPPSSVVTAVIEALCLSDLIATWGEPARRAANLDALVFLIHRYEEEAKQEGKAITLTGLIYWLEFQRSEETDLLPEVAGLEAIRVMTLHGAKGLEWPVVILFQDGGATIPHPFRAHLAGGDASHGRPLEGRTLTYWTYPFGCTQPYGTLAAEKCGVQDAARASAEGIAYRNAQIAEARRILYVGFTRAKHTLILAEGGRNRLSLLQELGNILPTSQVSEAEVLGATFITRTCGLSGPAATPPPEGVRWYPEATGVEEQIRRYWSPSSADSAGGVASAQDLPGPHQFGSPVETDDWQSLGQAVHSYLAALPALSGCDETTKLDHATGCLRRWGRQADLQASDLVKAGARLEAWAQSEAPDATWHVELPVSGPRSGGGQWTGSIDLVLDGAGGLIVIDHKSADYDRPSWEEKALEHSGQIKAYETILDSIGIRGMIHLPLGGGIVEITFPTPDPA